MSTKIMSIRQRRHANTSDDGLVADRIRSELGPLLKSLDQPHVHVMVSGGIAVLHGDVTDLAAGAAIEARVLATPGVRSVQSHLHVGLLPSDTVPSTGHAHERSPLLVELEHIVADCGFWSATEARRTLSGLLGVYSQRLGFEARRRFLDHLPADVRRLAQPPRWLSDDLSTVRREHDFAQTVAIATGTDKVQADQLVRRVLPVLRRHAPGDSSIIALALPPELRAIWLEHPSAGATSLQVPRPRMSHAPPPARKADLVPSTLRVGDVMTRQVVSVTPDDSLFAAFDAIASHGVHHLPVVRPDGHCVAILDAVTISERMPEAWLTRGHTPLWRPNGHIGPVCVLADTPLRHAAAEMDAAGVDACGVVDEHGALIGILTSRDLVAAVAGRGRTDD